jgi:hypothetical protein
MMKFYLQAICLMALACAVHGQELYVNTEPASNMASRSLGIRIENQGYFSPQFKNRSALELMYGASKNWMVHGTLYVSDYNQGQQRIEAGSVYVKYRFLSIDSVQRHFRGAFFARVSGSKNPVATQEIDLAGDNSGFESGVVFTQLLHKVALSGSASYLKALDNFDGYRVPAINAHDAFAYTLSAGYLLFPKVYHDYKQVNINVYAELLGKTNPGYGQSYLNAAPAVQFIFNSVFRVDLSYRVPLYNQMTRNSRNTYLIRLEYNLFNLF